MRRKYNKWRVSKGYYPKHPDNYKTQNGLLKAINKWHEKAVMHGWFIENVKFTIENVKFTDERQASRYVEGYRNNIEIVGGYHF